jgi:hypothetical protein
MRRKLASRPLRRKLKAEKTWFLEKRAGSSTKARRFRESSGPPQDEPEPIAASRDGWRDGRLQDQV